MIWCLKKLFRLANQETESLIRIKTADYFYKELTVRQTLRQPPPSLFRPQIVQLDTCPVGLSQSYLWHCLELNKHLIMFFCCCKKTKDEDVRDETAETQGLTKRFILETCSNDVVWLNVFPLSLFIFQQKTFNFFPFLFRWEHQSLS